MKCIKLALENGQLWGYRTQHIESSGFIRRRKLLKTLEMQYLNNLAPCSTVLRQKLTVLQLVKQFTAFYKHEA